MTDLTTSRPDVSAWETTIDSPAGDPIPLTIRRPSGTPRSHPLPALLFLHGFKGFKDWGGFPHVCEVIAAAGFHVVAMNFSHNGVEGSSQEFTRLDLFERNRVSLEVEEAASLLDALGAGSGEVGGDGIDRDRLALMGHSRGGGVALAVAPLHPELRGLILWAPVSTFDRYTDGQLERWRRDGFLEQRNMRTGQEMRLGLGLLDDLETHRDQLDPLRNIERLEMPILIIHGEQDLSVRIDEGERLAVGSNRATTEFVPIEGTNHTFGAVHPFEGTTPALDRAIATTIDFLERRLTPARDA